MHKYIYTYIHMYIHIHVLDIYIYIYIYYIQPLNPRSSLPMNVPMPFDMICSNEKKDYKVASQLRIPTPLDPSP